MIKITFQQILDQEPCVDGWARLLLNKGIIDQQTHDDWIDDEYIHMDGIVLPTEPFPLTDILGTNNFDDTLWCLRCLPEHDSLWRKYAVWCAYQVEHLMRDDRSKNALRVARAYAYSAAVYAARTAAYAAAVYADAKQQQEAKLRELLETETIECPWGDNDEN